MPVERGAALAAPALGMACPQWCASGADHHFLLL